MTRVQEECEPTAFNGAENEDIGEGGGEPYRGKVKYRTGFEQADHLPVVCDAGW